MSTLVGRPIVVGIDGSSDARRALCVAGDIVREVGADLVIVHSVGLTEVVDGKRVPSDLHTEEIAEQFDSWCEAVRDVGVDTWTPRLHHGSPVDVLLRVAKETGAGLIVIGRHGSGQRPERLLGSTAHQVAERSICPVLVIPPIGRVERPDG